MDTIGKLFEKLKKAHQFWVSGDLVYQARLEKAIEPTMKELESLGVARHFSESLLFFGKEFVDSLSEKDKNLNPAHILLIPMSSISRHENQEQGATDEEIEKIFDAKLQPMTEHEKRCAAIAAKYNISFYTILSKEGEDPKIKDLSFNRKNKK